jgi:hypothetical protein
LICRGDLHGFCVAVVRDLQVPLERESTPAGLGILSTK